MIALCTRVEFQTGPGSFGTGTVCSYDDATGRVVVQGDDGSRWSGFEEQVEAAADDLWGEK